MARRPPPPPTSPVASARKPIGVPDDYLAPGTRTRYRGPNRPGHLFDPMETVQVGVPPRYFEGDEWVPAAMSDEEKARLQRAMHAAGLLGPGFRIGVWDDTTRTAYRNLLELANGQGVDQMTALERYAASVEFDPDGELGKRRAPLVKRQTNPLDLAEIVRKVGTDVLGRYPDEPFVQQFIAEFQRRELADQQQAYDMGATDSVGGTITDLPNAETLAEDMLRDTYPGETGAMDIADRAEQFFELLRSA